MLLKEEALVYLTPAIPKLQAFSRKRKLSDNFIATASLNFLPAIGLLVPNPLEVNLGPSLDSDLV